MDLDVAWLMEPAQTVPLAEFEAWYVGRHTEIAKRLPGLRRYALSRMVEGGLLEAPGGLGGVHRVAQLAWRDAESAEDAFTSYDGIASFGDNLLGTGSTAYTRGVGLTWDRPLEVLRPAVFDVVAGAFRLGAHGGDGRQGHRLSSEVVKILAYGLGGPTPATSGSEAQAEVWAPVRSDRRVRAVVLGDPLGRPLHLGRVQVPASGTLQTTWSVECWCDSVEDSRAVVASVFEEPWRSWTAETSQVFRGIFASQEVFGSRTAVA